LVQRDGELAVVIAVNSSVILLEKPAEIGIG